jgi:hypothetical protein
MIQSYENTNRFKVKHLDIVEDFLEKYWIMVAMMRKGWTLDLVFVVE